MAKTRRRPGRRTRKRDCGAYEDRSRAGFTLVEVLVAMGIMSMMMISIVQLFVLSAYVNKSVEQRTRLANIAQMQTEELRRIYMSLPADEPKPAAITKYTEADTSYDPDNFVLADFKTHLTSGHGAVYIATLKPDPNNPASFPDHAIRTYERYTELTAMVDVVTVDYILNNPEGGLEAIVSWLVDDELYGDLGIEVRIDVRSGYALTGTPILRDISINYTAIFASRDFYQAK